MKAKAGVWKRAAQAVAEAQARRLSLVVWRAYWKKRSRRAAKPKR